MSQSKSASSRANAREFGKLLISSFTVFFSSKHLVRNAVYLQETLVELRRVLHLRKDESGFVKIGPIEPGSKIKLPDNPLVRDIQAVLINIFGGIVRCERIAHGVIEAAKEVKINVPLVVRLQGTNADEGRKLLAESGLKLEVANDLWEAAQKIVKLTGKAA